VARLAPAVAAGGRSDAPPLVRAPRTAELPLSFAQQRLWFLDRLVPDNPFYNMAAAVRLGGPLDGAALAAAWREIVRRHEVLRTRFRSVDGRPVQEVARGELAVPEIDLRALPAAGREAELLRLAAAEARRPFDLERGPVLRVHLVGLA